MSDGLLRHRDPLSSLDPDVLGEKLRASYRLASGRILAPPERRSAEADAAEVDAKLGELRLAELKNDAALFYIAVGMLQPPG